MLTVFFLFVCLLVCFLGFLNVHFIDCFFLSRDLFFSSYVSIFGSLKQLFILFRLVYFDDPVSIGVCLIALYALISRIKAKLDRLNESYL